MGVISEIQKERKEYINLKKIRDAKGFFYFIPIKFENNIEKELSHNFKILLRYEQVVLVFEDKKTRVRSCLDEKNVLEGLLHIYNHNPALLEDIISQIVKVVDNEGGKFAFSTPNSTYYIQGITLIADNDIRFTNIADMQLNVNDFITFLNLKLAFSVELKKLKEKIEEYMLDINFGRMGFDFKTILQKRIENIVIEESI